MARELPRQERTPYPKGKKPFFADAPGMSANRSGMKSFGFSHISGSRWVLELRPVVHRRHHAALHDSSNLVLQLVLHIRVLAQHVGEVAQQEGRRVVPGSQGREQLILGVLVVRLQVREEAVEHVLGHLLGPLLHQLAALVDVALNDVVTAVDAVVKHLLRPGEHPPQRMAIRHVFAHHQRTLADRVGDVHHFVPVLPDVAAERDLAEGADGEQGVHGHDVHLLAEVRLDVLLHRVGGEPRHDVQLLLDARLHEVLPEAGAIPLVLLVL
eukprot:scaffold2771_cov252-Pinguiococcus_pyrenoidosus.AAC.2